MICLSKKIWNTPKNRWFKFYIRNNSNDKKWRFELEHQDVNKAGICFYSSTKSPNPKSDRTMHIWIKTTTKYLPRKKINITLAVIQIYVITILPLNVEIYIKHHIDNITIGRTFYFLSHLLVTQSYKLVKLFNIKTKWTRNEFKVFLWVLEECRSVNYG